MRWRLISGGRVAMFSHNDWLSYFFSAKIRALCSNISCYASHLEHQASMIKWRYLFFMAIIKPGIAEHFSGIMIYTGYFSRINHQRISDSLLFHLDHRIFSRHDQIPRSRWVMKWAWKSEKVWPQSRESCTGCAGTQAYRAQKVRRSCVGRTSAFF